jgi:hypothetical protein
MNETSQPQLKILKQSVIKNTTKNYDQNAEDQKKHQISIKLLWNEMNRPSLLSLEDTVH